MKLSLNLFDIDSIKQAQKELEKYRDSLESKARQLAERLSQEGVEIARVQVASLDAIFTGELIESIHTAYVGSESGGATFVIRADSEHAIYVEMGTGIVGKEHPYPYDLPSGVTWNYDSGKTIGWYQVGDEMLYGWWYKGKDGKYHFTQGMEARPFMSNTALELKSKVFEITKEIFNTDKR